MRLYSLAAAALLIAATPAHTPKPSAFCTGLKSIAAQTATNFMALRGVPISGKDNTFAATSGLVGAIPSTCQIAGTFYRCFFEYGSGKRLDGLGRVIDAITACIGPTSEDDFDVYTADDVGEVKFVRATFEISVNASDSQPLVLLISKPIP